MEGEAITYLEFLSLDQLSIVSTVDIETTKSHYVDMSVSLGYKDSHLGVDLQRNINGKFT